MKKRPFSLLEIVIAFLLVALLMFVVFESQRHFKTQEKIVSEMQEISLERQRISLRLKPLFLHLENLHWDGKRVDIWYESLIDPIQEFRGSLVSTLEWYGGELFLTTWGPKGKLRHEVLMVSKENTLNCLLLDEKENKWREFDSKEPIPDFFKLVINGTEFPFLIQKKESR